MFLCHFFRLLQTYCKYVMEILLKKCTASELMKDMFYIAASTVSKPTCSGICVFIGMWTHRVWSFHDVLLVSLKSCSGGNWILWIITYPWWILFGFVVATGLPGPCTSVYESCIKRTLQDTAKQKALCLHTDIMPYLIDRSRPRWSPFAWCQTLDHIRDVRLKMKRNIH